ncbi:MAG: DUF3710 domain-containing protein [Dermatophilaceae bacterium]
MGIFGRRQRGPAASDLPEAAEPADLETPDPAVEDEAVDLGDGGPYDREQVLDVGDRLDLGSLWLPAVDGMTVRLEVDESSQVVTTAHVGIGGSELALSAFAAPRSQGVWAEIRAEIAASIVGQHGRAEVVDGPLGREIVADLPGSGPRARFLGVDGPRWFLRGVLTGPAATDASLEGPLLEVLRQVVVVRGSVAMGPRELLPLRLPDAVAAAAAEAAAQSAQAPSRVDDLKPFDRGPEITEVR